MIASRRAWLWPSCQQPEIDARRRHAGAAVDDQGDAVSLESRIREAADVISSSTSR